MHGILDKAEDYYESDTTVGQPRLKTETLFTKVVQNFIGCSMHISYYY